MAQGDPSKPSTLAAGSPELKLCSLFSPSLTTHRPCKKKKKKAKTEVQLSARSPSGYPITLKVK